MPLRWQTCPRVFAPPLSGRAPRRPARGGHGDRVLSAMRSPHVRGVGPSRWASPRPSYSRLHGHARGDSAWAPADLQAAADSASRGGGVSGLAVRGGGMGRGWTVARAWNGRGAGGDHVGTRHLHGLRRVQADIHPRTAPVERTIRESIERGTTGWIPHAGGPVPRWWSQGRGTRRGGLQSRGASQEVTARKYAETEGKRLLARSAWPARRQRPERVA